MTASTLGASQQTPPPADTSTRGSLSSYARGYVDRVRGGEVGALPAILGLIALCIVFTAFRPVFFSAGNFANLLTQGAAVTVIAMGLIFVLLIGEIDLSAGFAAGVCSSVLATLMTNHGVPWPLAVLAALATGLVIGTVLGTLVARLGIPSFVVTLSGFLAFQGLVLLIIGQGGTISVRSPVILALANKNVPPLWGWIGWAVIIAGWAYLSLSSAAKRRRLGLVAPPMPVVIARLVIFGVLSGLAVYVLNLERSRNVIVVSLRGVPWVVPVILLLVLGLTFLLTRTSYGRHLFAVGGNAEAARRAGINVPFLRTSAFMISSTMAAIGGIILASRATSVDPNAGGSNTLLYAVGAAVIGGTSLFGGRGKVRDAILGGAVVAVIANGMGLLGYSAGIQYIVTGAVLLLAASVDALSRRRSAASGRA